MKYIIGLGILFLSGLVFLECTEKTPEEVVTVRTFRMAIDTLVSKNQLNDSLVSVRKPWSDVGGQANMTKVIKSYREATKAAAAAKSSSDRLLDSLSKISKEIANLKASMLPYDTTVFQIRKGSISLSDEFVIKVLQ